MGFFLYGLNEEKILEDLKNALFTVEQNDKKVKEAIDIVTELNTSSVKYNIVE